MCQEYILLKVKHKYDDEYEDLALCSSMEKVEELKKKYQKLMEPVPANDYTFASRL